MPRGSLPMPVSDGVIKAVARHAKERGVRVLLDEMPDLLEVSSVISHRDVDGVVVFLADDCPLDALQAMRRQLPVVWAMGGQAGPIAVDHVSENNIAIGYLAHHYLSGHGCRNVAFLSTVPQKRNAQQRWQGFTAASARAEHPCRALVQCDAPGLLGLYGGDAVARMELLELVQAFVSLSPRPTGLFVDRDSTLSRVQSLLLRHGVEPGRDVRLVSCDNDESVLSALYPRPASIDVGVSELGLRIVRTLLARIENPDDPPVFIQTMPRLCPGEADEVDAVQA
jgi:LacI family transcriptional regulator